jgi:hypothetical protein
MLTANELRLKRERKANKRKVKRQQLHLQSIRAKELQNKANLRARAMQIIANNPELLAKYQSNQEKLKNEGNA